MTSFVILIIGIGVGMIGDALPYGRGQRVVYLIGAGLCLAAAALGAATLVMGGAK